MTSVVGFGATNEVACEIDGARSEVAVAAYFRTVLPVHAASDAVTGTPSDHLPPLFSVNVQVLPSADVVQFVARSAHR